MDRRRFLYLGAAGAAAAVAPSLIGCRRRTAAGPGLDAVATPGDVGVVPPVAQVGPPALAPGYFERGFGIDEAIVRRTLARGMSRGGDYCDVFLEHKVADFVAYEDGRVNQAYVQVDLGAGVRVLKGDQTGYAFTEELTPEAMARAAETAAAIAAGSAGAAPDTFRRIEVPPLYAREAIWSGIPPSDKLALVDRIGARTGGADPAVIKASVRFRSEDDAVLIANTDGAWAEDRRPMTYVYATCVAEKNGRRETGWSSRARRDGLAFYSDTRVAELSDEAVMRTLLLFEAVAPPPGGMPVVLAPATSGILLHEAMGHGFEADFNRKGISIFASMLGRKVASEFVTIVDTGLEPQARGALGVDDEGTLGQRTVLVENGRLVSYLHDRISATHYGVERTGNGRREDFRFPPIPRMRVTLMENGPHDPEEIIRSVSRGLYAVDFSNGEVNIGAGDYSFYVKVGYLIEDGKITAPVKDVNLIGNGPDTLSKVTMVGSDRRLDGGTWTCGKDGQGVPVGLGLPTVLVSSVNVGGVQS